MQSKTLRQLRTEKKLRPCDVAKKFGVSASQMRAYEDLDEVGSLDEKTKQAIVNCLSLTVSYYYPSQHNPARKYKSGVERICLKCNKEFESYNGNRICDNCHVINSSILDGF